MEPNVAGPELGRALQKIHDEVVAWAGDRPHAWIKNNHASIPIWELKALLPRDQVADDVIPAIWIDVMSISEGYVFRSRVITCSADFGEDDPIFVQDAQVGLGGSRIVALFARHHRYVITVSVQEETDQPDISSVLTVNKWIDLAPKLRFLRLNVG
jgi:hypothetical protein